jgi:hypothetical protein
MKLFNRENVAGLLLLGTVAGCSTMPPFVGDWSGEGTFDGVETSVSLAVNNDGKFRGYLTGPTNQWHVGFYEVTSSNADRIVLKADVLTDLHSRYPSHDPDVHDASIEWLSRTNGEPTLVYQFERQDGRIETFSLTK